MSFCTLGVNRNSDDGIDSSYQKMIRKSLNSESKVKNGVCQECLRLRLRLTVERLKFFLTVLYR